VLRDEGQVGWAIRRGSPGIRSVLEAFFREYVKKEGVIEYRLVQFERNIKQITSNANGPALKRFEQTAALFRTYGARYDFDYLMLTAQGFQESRLDQSARSRVGAIGVMQIMPATGRELGVGDINRLEPNIHAGAKYLDRLMARYFPEAHFSEEE